MAKKSLHKSLHVYLSKLKRNPLLLSTCNYLNAPHATVAADRGRGATLSDVDRHPCKNFGSLYPGSGGNDVTISGPTADFSSPRFSDPPAAAIRASKRFFVVAGPTSSLIEEARLSSASSGRPPDALATVSDNSSAAVVTVSVDPYVDFKRSMQEMVDARHVGRTGPLDWGFLEDLLTRYLELNERSVHECILRAFMDLTEELRRQGTEVRRRKRMMGGERV